MFVFDLSKTNNVIEMTTFLLQTTCTYGTTSLLSYLSVTNYLAVQKTTLNFKLKYFKETAQNGNIT